MTHEIDGRHVVDHGGKVTYYPFVSPEGRVGYRVVHHFTHATTYIYFNPSVNTPEMPDEPNVFVCEGKHNDPAADFCSHHYVVTFEESPIE